VTFIIGADAYDRFMGRYSSPLARLFADFTGVVEGQRALDVGCGPGALTTELVGRLGPGNVSAVDPSPPFVAAARERYPAVDVKSASAESLPFEDETFDTALAQLVVQFMSDPTAGLREMARVTREGGVVAACVWDQGGGRGPLSVFWRAAHDVDPDVEDESQLAGGREGQLRQLFGEAGLREIEERSLVVEVEHSSFEEWWEPFTLGVGPAGAYVKTLDDRQLDALRERCRAVQASPPFTVSAMTWAARGLA
jgi:SAM-dependent methyltransferase